MKTVLLHGLGQTAQDWKEVVQQLSISDVDCPELFSSAEDEISYSKILGDLEQRYSEVKEPLRICGLSLGALLAIDFAIRHEEKVASMVLIGAQYKVPSLLIDFQNLIFRCMPNKAFESMGLSKSSTIKLAHSMRSLDFTSQLDNIHCPVTILCGKKDTANLKASKRLKELLPQATLHIVPNAGHELNKYAPNTIAEILNMADKVATQLTGSWQEWAGFLTTASRLYKYPFHEQLMIYAQRPDATACAEYDLWNEKMGRYVRRCAFTIPVAAPD